MVAFAVQLHGRGDEAGVWSDTEQSLRVRLGINREPGEGKVGLKEGDS